MRTAIVSSVLLLGACGQARLAPQTLLSDCVGQPVEPKFCPACSMDSDCHVVTNLCQESGSCVPRAGSWAATAEGCDVQHAPTTATCACVQSVCQAK